VKTYKVTIIEPPTGIHTTASRTALGGTKLVYEGCTRFSFQSERIFTFVDMSDKIHSTSFDFHVVEE
jgi:hypothetical protein